MQSDPCIRTYHILKLYGYETAEMSATRTCFGLLQKGIVPEFIFVLYFFLFSLYVVLILSRICLKIMTVSRKSGKYLSSRLLIQVSWETALQMVCRVIYWKIMYPVTVSKCLTSAMDFINCIEFLQKMDPWQEIQSLR